MSRGDTQYQLWFQLAYDGDHGDTETWRFKRRCTGLDDARRGMKEMVQDMHTGDVEIRMAGVHTDKFHARFRWVEGEIVLVDSREYTPEQTEDEGAWPWE